MALTLDRCIELAAFLHRGQKRKYTGEPYVCHAIEVVSILASRGYLDEVMLSAAVLHDVIEDCGVTAYQLNCQYFVSSDVIALVEELTEPQHIGNRATRKAAEAQRLATISATAQTIKYADLISNTRSIVRHDPDFARVYLREKQTILDVMDKGDPWLREKAQDLVNESLTLV